MTNKLSHSALNKYLQCPRLFENHYVKRLRGKTTSGALLIGGAIDKSLNELLTSKDLSKAIEVFDKEFEYGFINDEKVYLPESELIVYAKKDFDEELITLQDWAKLDQKTDEGDPLDRYKETLEYKETKGFENLTTSQKQFYNLANWLCLRRKAHIMLKAYSEKVLPKIKKVVAVQKEFNLVGKKGDVIPGWIDLVVEWEDGKRYIIDNKTSTWEYESDSASKSQQLIMYHYAGNKEGLKLDGVGFVVMYKQIQKNRIKICEKCGHNGTGGRHKTCDNNETLESNGNRLITRCNGTWKETISPECKIDIILNEVTKPAQNLIIQSFLGANEGIKAGVFPPNVDSCHKYGQPCVYAKLCWEGKDDNLIQLPEKEQK